MTSNSDQNSSSDESEKHQFSQETLEAAAKEIVAIEKKFLHSKTNVVNERRRTIRSIVDRYAGGGNEN